MIKKYIPIIVLIILAAIIMLPHLDRPAFWQDEAESALLARSILHYGIPHAWNGTNIITQLSGNDSNANGVWSFTPWLPFYIIAGSFKVLGETNFAGRLPFVIIGLLGLLSLYFLVRRLTGNARLAALSSLILLSNFQFILYSRQCKYYSILFFVPPVLIYAYCMLFRRPVILSASEGSPEHRGSFAPLRMTKSFMMTIALFTFSLIILFYTNFVSLFTFMIGLAIYQLTGLLRPFRSRNDNVGSVIASEAKQSSVRFFTYSAIAALFCIPFFFVGSFGVSSSLISGLPSLAMYLEKLGRHIWYFNNMVFGMILFIPLIIFWRKKYFTAEEKGLLKLFLWIIIPAWLVLPLFNQDVFRYNLHLLPLFAAIIAVLVLAFFRWSKISGTIFLTLILFTNVFSNMPYVSADLVARQFNGKGLPEYGLKIQGADLETITTHALLKPEFAAHYNELTTNYPDAIASVVTFLKANAKKGDIVYANFDLLPLMFYLPDLRFAYQIDPAALKVPKNFTLPAYVTSAKDVDWYFYLPSKMNLGPYLTNEEFMAMHKNVVPNDLGISSLYFDINWAQRFYPYINKLLWRDVSDFKNVTVYKVE